MSLRVWLSTVLILGLAVGTALGQSIKEEQKALHDALVKQQKIMRGFSAEKDIHWQWDGSALVEDPPQLRMAAMFVASSVKVKGEKVEIDGERFPLSRDSKGNVKFSQASEKVRLQVDMAGANASVVLPQLVGLLFYPDTQSGIAELAAEGHAIRSIPVPETPTAPRQLSGPDLKTCDCTQPDAEGCAALPPKTAMTGMTPPTLLKGADPQFPDEARGRNFSGGVDVFLKVDEQGMPKDLWIVEAAGMGLDEQAAAAVRQYRFRPATCHGKPMEVDLYVVINFRVF